MTLSRREALSGLGCLAIGGITGGLTSTAYSRESKTSVFPWPYEILGPDMVAERAYKNYFSHHCMYAPFEAIVGELADKFGEPYASFPFEMMVYGAGGVAGWGTLCGALNGPAAAIQLLSKNPAAIISELYRWYEITPMPNIHLEIAADKDGRYPVSLPVAASVSGSVICHVIISKWVKDSGKRLGSADKLQRCAQSAASVAKKTVELLNDEKSGKLVLTHQLSDETQGCMKCHSGSTSRLKDTQGKMECLSCHEEH